MSASFGPGSVSLGIYAHDVPARAQVADLISQALLARKAGFDGVTVSEHHAGFPGYLPNPILVTAWLLDESPEIWCAPCPMLLSARPVTYVIEDIAWLAARHQGRVGVAFTPGYVAADFLAPGLDFAKRRDRFGPDLLLAAAALTGNPPPELAGDRALLLCAEHPVPILATAETVAGANRAARAGAGILMAAHNPISTARKVFDAYAAAGGTGPRVLIRRVHVGDLPPAARAGLADLYRPQGMTENDLQLVNGEDPAQVGKALTDIVETSDATALNLRVNLRGMTPEDTREQISLLAKSLTAFRLKVDVQDQRLI